MGSPFFPEPKPQPGPTAGSYTFGNNKSGKNKSRNPVSTAMNAFFGPNYKDPKSMPGPHKSGFIFPSSADPAKLNPARVQNDALEQARRQASASIPTAVNPTPDPTPVGADLDALYADVIGRTDEYNKTGLAAYDEALKRVQGNYDRSSAEMYQQYMNSRNKGNDMAAGLGASQDIYKDWDGNARRLQESTDLALADNRSFFDKMKGAQAANYQEFLAGLQAQKAQQEVDQGLAILDYMQAQEEAKKGGGRGSRGGGGGRSSGSATETANMSEQLFNVGDIETYNQLLATDPEMAAVYLASLQVSSGSPVVKELARRAQELADTELDYAPMKPKKGNNWAINAYNQYATSKNNKAQQEKDKRQQTINLVQGALQAAMGTSGLLGNPFVKADVKSKSSRRTQ